jgi:hypothetical protein
MATARQPHADGHHARLWFAYFDYMLVCVLRRLPLARTEFAKETCGSIRRNS